MKKMSMCLIVITVVAMFISNPSFAKEKVTEIARESWGASYELVVNDAGSYLRTKVQDFIDRNNGDSYAGLRVAKICLRAKLVELVSGAKKTETNDGYKLSVSGHVRASVEIKDGYAIIKIADAEVDGQKAVLK